MNNMRIMSDNAKKAEEARQRKENIPILLDCISY